MAAVLGDAAGLIAIQVGVRAARRKVKCDFQNLKFSDQR